MSIKRFIAIKDTTITNARRQTLSTSGSLSNMGAADSGQIFSVYNATGFNTSSSQNDLSRILVQFDISSISNDSDIPPNAEVKLKLFNVAHPETLPRDFKLTIHPVTRSWTEGRGLDLESYWDLGSANWLSASDGTVWSTPGGDFDYHYSPELTQSFSEGYEDLEVDITSLYASWKSGSLTNNGLLLKLTSSQEYSTESFYKKMFSMRGSEFFFSRPILEFRWNDYIFDDRNNAYASSALAPLQDNLNTLFFFNRIRGQLKNIPIVEATGSIYLRLFTGTITGIPIAWATGVWSGTGIYSASFQTTYTGSSLYDVWYHHDNSTVLFTGTINNSLGRMKQHTVDYYDWNDEFVLSMPNLKKNYKINDKQRLDLFVRKRIWQANVYLKASQDQEQEFIKKAYYRVRRPIDDKTIIDFGTGSIEYTRLSYDKDGNYFNFDMNILEPGYEYEFNFLFDIDGKKSVQTDRFKFRVNN